MTPNLRSATFLVLDLSAKAASSLPLWDWGGGHRSLAVHLLPPGMITVSAGGGGETFPEIPSLFFLLLFTSK